MAVEMEVAKEVVTEEDVTEEGERVEVIEKIGLHA